MRTHLEEVEATKRVKWSRGSTSAVWTNRPLVENLCNVFLRRLMETEKAGGEGVAMNSQLFAPLGDVVAFLNSETDDDLLGDLLWAFIGIDWASRSWFTCLARPCRSKCSAGRFTGFPILAKYATFDKNSRDVTTR